MPASKSGERMLDFEWGLLTYSIHQKTKIAGPGRNNNTPVSWPGAFVMRGALRKRPALVQQ
jgi:hypothetical protein